jgi:hypothetical protein
MIVPTVTETTPRLEPVTPDPFIAPVTRPTATTPPAAGSLPAARPPVQLALRM